MVENSTGKSIDVQALTFTDRMRVLFKGILDPIAAFLNRLRFNAQYNDIVGFVWQHYWSIFPCKGRHSNWWHYCPSMGPIDALDGTMARLRGMTGNFGAFVDLVTDRYSELVIFLGLLYYFSRQGNTTAVVLVYFAAAGSVMVSYVRARSQSLGWDTKVGILTRMERYLVLAPSLIFNIPIVGLWILAVLANFTALQRIVDVRRLFYQQRLETKRFCKTMTIPTGFQLGPIYIYFYGIIIMTGALCGTWLASREAQRKGQNPDLIWDALIWLLSLGIVGARLWHVLLPPQSSIEQGITTAWYFLHPLDMLNTRQGGLGIPGAVLGGMLGLFIFTRRNKLSFALFADFCCAGFSPRPGDRALGKFRQSGTLRQPYQPALGGPY